RELIAGLDERCAALVQLARDRFARVEGLREQVAWVGVPWRWTFRFVESDGDTRPRAFVVPQPGRPAVAMPLTLEQVERLQSRRISRFVRDGVAAAPVVGGVRWAEWEIANPGQVDEVAALLHQAVQSAVA